MLLKFAIPVTKIVDREINYLKKNLQQINIKLYLSYLSCCFPPLAAEAINGTQYFHFIFTGGLNFFAINSKIISNDYNDDTIFLHDVDF